MDIATSILKSLGIPITRICEKYGKLPGYSNLELVDAIVVTNSTKEAGILLGGYSEDSINLKLKIFKLRKPSNERWYNTFLKQIEYKKCSGCNSILPYSCFYKSVTKSHGKSSLCKECDRLSCSTYAKNNPEVIRSYKELNKGKYAAYSANRRAKQLQATPPWADLSLIAEKYITCPEGYHVDHEIPLQGELVSGLHVHTNLRHLPALENLRKSNTFLV